ncbi:hypothetical protein [Streptomyces chryseus]|uniref:Uncharacterized protein n=1 Tax=Streptomyces chryseus TaxID=68186 RepID=A0ABQ3DJT3_9ACTN|nr:hypothetical protein [Streptomyces chryseus]GHA94194.1 hypothetical protein GCM10010346_16170 [Streptomyces chryseus]
MTPSETALLDRLTEALLTTWHERVEAGIVTDPAAHCAALAAAAIGQLGHRPVPAGPAGDDLPSYTGPFVVCAKCSHTEAITRFRAAGEHSTQDRPTFRPSRKGERLERQCWSCDYTWDEALNPPDGDPRVVDVATLATALQEAHRGWALDLSPECAEHMARQLLGNLVVYRNDLLEGEPADAPAAADVDQEGAAA